MKRTDIYRIYPLAAALLLAGCMVEESDGSRADVPVMLTATVLETGHGPMATRAGVDVQSTQLPNGATFRAEFSGSDVTETTATYTADGTGGATASPQPYFTLTGTSTTVSAYHGKSGGTGGTQVTGATTSFTVASDQTGDAAYQASDLMYATATVQKSNPVGALTFTHRMAKIIVNATLGDGISSISAVKIIGGLPTVALSGTDCTVGAASGTAFSTSNPLTVHSGTSTAATLNCAALIPPQRIPAEGSAETNFLQVTTDQGDVTYSLDSKVFASGQSYTFNIAVNAAAVGATVAITNWSDNGSVTVETGGGGGPIPTVSAHAPSGVEAVDLGLSVKWANMNVGAMTERGYGTYFAWGETIGYTVLYSNTTPVTPAPTKTAYDWANYWWGSSQSDMTKYNATDKKTELDLSDDAAYINWGGKWRMPTQAEMQELTNKDNCTWTWQSNYNNSDVAGYLVTSKKTGYTSKFIFLPFAGERYNTTFKFAGSFYWSSSLNSDRPHCAWYLYFDLYDMGGVYNGGVRVQGFSVRPVQSN